MFAGERVKLLALGRVKLDPSTRGIWVTLGPIVLSEPNPFSVVLLPDSAVSGVIFWSCGPMCQGRLKIPGLAG